MILKQIESLRERIYHPSYHLVHEWEDGFSKALGIPVHNTATASYLMDYHLFKRDIFGISFKTKRHLFFELYAWKSSPLKHSRTRIPIIIDYYLDKDGTKSFIQNSEKSRLVLITSREVYEYLLKEGANPDKIKHLALSLPDAYRLDPKKELKKEYDVILVGRTSPVFLSFLEEYQKKHPGLSVLTQKVEDGHYNFYDPAGNCVGNADTRQSYIGWMRKSRILFYSSSGYDGERATNGFSQVTPKFLEALACGCHVIMRYADNPDTRYYGLAGFNESAETYAQFEKQMDHALAAPPDLESYARYLQKHYTSQRAQELKQILSNV